MGANIPNRKRNEVINISGTHTFGLNKLIKFHRFGYQHIINYCLIVLKNKGIKDIINSSSQTFYKEMYSIDKIWY